MALEPISKRDRPIKRTWSDGIDMYGKVVLRAEFEGDEPMGPIFPNSVEQILSGSTKSKDK